MRSLSSAQLTSFAKRTEEIVVGAQLQNVWSSDQDLILEFYKYKSFYLCFDLHNSQPYVVLLDQAPPISKKNKPVVLFLNAHARGLRLVKLDCLAEKGRVLELQLQGGDKKCGLEAQLIPRSVNIIVETDDKKISWNKPRELPPSKIQSEIASVVEEINWEEWAQIWWNERFKSKSKTEVDIEVKSKKDPRFRALEKKTKALAQILNQMLKSDREVEIKKWRELGMLLKSGDELPEAYQEFYNPQESRNWNMENSFQRAKEITRKLEGMSARRELLEKEILQLEKELSGLQDLQVSPLVFQPPPASILKKSESKGRTLSLENGLQAVCGKSAKDNLAILRKAQPWDLWLHLRDYPGAHAIITRPRNLEVDLDSIERVSQWVFRESLKGKNLKMGLKLGIKLDVVVVECRHVRPIKGDKLGRVTYHNPKIFSFASKIESY